MQFAAQPLYALMIVLQYNRLHAKGLLSTHSEPEDIRSGRNVQEISSRLKPVDIKGENNSTIVA